METIKNGDGESVVVIFKGSLNYPAAEHMKETINAIPKEYACVKKIIVDMGCVYHIDYAIVNTLRSIIQELDGKVLFSS